MTVQQQLLHEIYHRGTVESLLALTTSLGINYRWAWVVVRRLETEGLVAVHRRPGHPLHISVISGDFSRAVMQ